MLRCTQRQHLSLNPDIAPATRAFSAPVYRDSEPGLGWIGAPLLITTGNTCVKRSISSSSSFTSHAATDFLQFCQNYSHDDGGAREQ